MAYTWIMFVPGERVAPYDNRRQQLMNMRVYLRILIYRFGKKLKRVSKIVD
jgi:hypothetical protein